MMSISRISSAPETISEIWYEDLVDLLAHELQPAPTWSKRNMNRDLLGSYFIDDTHMGREGDNVREDWLDI